MRAQGVDDCDEIGGVGWLVIRLAGEGVSPYCGGNAILVNLINLTLKYTRISNYNMDEESVHRGYKISLHSGPCVSAL